MESKELLLLQAGEMLLLLLLPPPLLVMRREEELLLLLRQRPHGAMHTAVAEDGRLRLLLQRPRRLRRLLLLVGWIHPCLGHLREEVVEEAWNREREKEKDLLRPPWKRRDFFFFLW